jgi:hypothetical protein
MGLSRAAASATPATFRLDVTDHGSRKEGVPALNKPR